MRLEDGGLEKVVVRDNGCGVPPEQLVAMVAPHTTSKLQQFSDLSCLTTLGFRGEALAALAGLAELTITSRTAASATATTVTCSPGNPCRESGVCAATPGTEVVVRHRPPSSQLWYNFKIAEHET